jgi:DnaJ-class molecular chaperone
MSNYLRIIFLSIGLSAVGYIIYDHYFSYPSFEEAAAADKEMDDAMAEFEQELLSEEEENLEPPITEDYKETKSEASQSKKIICQNCNGTGDGKEKCKQSTAQCKSLGYKGCDGEKVVYNWLTKEYQTCGCCDGSGFVRIDCRVCSGKGRVNEYE